MTYKKAYKIEFVSLLVLVFSWKDLWTTHPSHVDFYRGLSAEHGLGSTSSLLTPFLNQISLLNPTQCPRYVRYARYVLMLTIESLLSDKMLWLDYQVISIIS